MGINSRWYRVTKKRPCAICGHPDWCGYNDEVAICMRVQSDKPTRNGGWLHRTGDPIPRYVAPIRPAIPEKPINAEGQFNRWLKETDFHHLDGFAMSLDVDTEALQAIGCAWNGRAWAFPMKDAKGRIIGIRLRGESGSKWAVTGSKQGLFIPDLPVNETLHLVEGPTDLAAALSLELYAIGRPSCLGCEDSILQFIREQKIRRVVIVTDNDEPGLRGADKLQNLLPVMSCIWVPPAKDLREFVSRGGTRSLIDASLKDLVWQRPRKIAA